VAAEDKEREVAFVKCKGDCNVAVDKYEYFGIEDCTMASQLAGKGAKGCTYGCMGLGSCVKACMFGALRIENGVAVVDPDKCTGCKKCIAACPKNLIELVPVSKVVRVACNSRDKGKDVTPNCKVGCIACQICKKNCPAEAITIEDNVAHIDYEKCTLCGICATKCPKKTIIDPNMKPPAPKAAPAAKPADAAPTPKADPGIENGNTAQKPAPEAEPPKAVEMPKLKAEDKEEV